MDYLVGDVQGLCRRLRAAACTPPAFSPARPPGGAGDLVNRGLGRSRCCRRLRALEGAATLRAGQPRPAPRRGRFGARGHAAATRWRPCWNAPDRDEWIAWLRRQRMACVEAGWLCVHAGLVPQWTRRRRWRWRLPSGGLLRGPDLSPFLKRMYGNEPLATRRTASIRASSAGASSSTCSRASASAPTRRARPSDQGGANATARATGPGSLCPGRRTRQAHGLRPHWSTLGLVQRPRTCWRWTPVRVGRRALTAVRVGRRPPGRCSRCAPRGSSSPAASAPYQRALHLRPSTGEMAERSIAPVLKTGDGNRPWVRIHSPPRPQWPPAALLCPQIFLYWSR